MRIKLYGYPVGSEADEPLSLDEVSIQCGPDELRAIGDFFLKVADTMEKHPSTFGHEHLSLFVELEGTGDIVIVGMN